MNNFFDSKRFKILLIVLAFLAGTLAYAGANGRLTAAPQEILSLLVSPFQWAASTVSSKVGSYFENRMNMDEIIAENETLREENADLRNQLVDYDRITAENEAYKALEGIREENPERTYVSGFVIGRDTLDTFGSFTVNIGSLSGVEKGDTVISDDGYLVGTVQEVSLAECRVLTILHPAFSAAAAVSRTRDSGILCGDSAYSDQKLCTVTNLPRDTFAAVGDQIITTGLGGVYPSDLLVGTITELLPESGGKSVVATVQPGADITGLTHVFIITDY